MAINAGFDAGEVIDAAKARKDDKGFDVKTGKWINRMDNGIIDPTKVTRTAVVNSASIASLFITTEAVVTEIPKPAAPAAAPAGNRDRGY